MSKARQKRDDTLNKNLPKPIHGFRPNTTLKTMRRKTGKTTIEAVRRIAKRMLPKKTDFDYIA